MKKFRIWVVAIFLVSISFSQNQNTELEQEALRQMMQKIWTRLMVAKQSYRSGAREDNVLSNLSSTAPREEFIIHTDVSDSLVGGIISAKSYVSTDEQSSWYSNENMSLIGSLGYENTWGGSVNTNGGNEVFWYISGEIYADSLGQEMGNIIVSGSPHNEGGAWPPPSSLYATMATDPSGDAPSNQDLLAMFGTYKGALAFDEFGDGYTDVERFYLGLTINDNCCDEGGLFGPWYLYGIGIINPDSENDVAYALGYGDGGFGQLSPGLLKITGDLDSGEIENFEYLTYNVTTNTSGNQLQATAMMNYLSSDSDWGPWPNSINGFLLLGMTVEADLDGFGVSANILDQTNPGLMICETEYQGGNNLLELSDPGFDIETNILSVSYFDADGNLPWLRSVQICDPGTDNCFYQQDLTPDAHTYDEGVLFSASFNGDEVPNGDYDARFWFADDDIVNYMVPQLILPISVVGGSECGSVGDLNEDIVVNVLDVVSLVNIILCADCPNNYDDCGDINGDGVLNVLDVVLLANIILEV